MNIHHTIQIWQKGSWFIARCPELDFVTQGRAPDEAQKNLLEVIEIQFEEMLRMGTLTEYLEECGYELHKDTAAPLSEMIGFQKFLTQLPSHA
jgi:predicted RNase H-like HicB family nuclease